MLPTPRMALAAIPLIVLAAGLSPTGAGPGEPLVAARVQSSLTTANRQVRQFAFDRDPNTAFVSAGIPTTSDHLTLTFDVPVPLTSVEVVSGHKDGSLKLQAGSLEISEDGQAFVLAARFGDDGKARFQLKGRAIRAIRVRPGATARHPLVIRDFALESPRPIARFACPVEFKVDVADSPEMKPWADEVARLCERWYDRINEELESNGDKPATWVELTLKASYEGVAMAGGTKITGSVRYFQDHPKDLGAMIHETCHVVQRYRGRRNPGWLVEGIADYVRFFVYEPGHASPVDPRSAHYSDSYQTSATFLDHVARKYDRHLVLKLNRLLRAGEYREGTFLELTGKTLAELDEEWLASLR